MLTKEQEQKIRDALNEAYKIKGNLFLDLIIAGIKAYDELKDVEEVKAAVKAANNSGNDDGCHVVFRHDDKRGSEMWVFNSIGDMSEKLNAKLKIEDIPEAKRVASQISNTILEGV